MGLFDKITSGAKSIGEKLTSEETKDAVKTGMAKASGGLASGLNKLSEKLSESSGAEVSYRDFIGILMDEDASKDQYDQAYKDAQKLFKKRHSSVPFFLVEALGIWRGVHPEYDADPYLSLSMSLAVHKEGLLGMTDSPESDEMTDLLFDVAEGMPDMMSEIFEMTNNIENKKFLQAYYLMNANMYGWGTDIDLRKTMLMGDYATATNAVENTEDKDDNDSIARGILIVCDRRIEKAKAQIDILLDDGAGEDAWREATEEIYGLAGLDYIVMASGMAMLYRGIIEEEEELGLVDFAVVSTYLAWYYDYPLLDHVMEIHGKMAAVFPELYRAAAEAAEKRADFGDYLYLCCAYLYGWGGEKDIAKAHSYAEKIQFVKDEEDASFGEVEAAEKLFELTSEQ